MQDDYQRRYDITIKLIEDGTIQADNYRCVCGRINVFGGEGYVDPQTKLFHCGYCDSDQAKIACCMIRLFETEGPRAVMIDGSPTVRFEEGSTEYTKMIHFVNEMIKIKILNGYDLKTFGAVYNSKADTTISTWTLIRDPK